MKKLLSAALLSAAFAVPAHACTQANLSGKWGVYVQSNGGNNYAIACAVIISSSGAISASNSNCSGTNGLNSSVSGSIRLKTANICNYTGAITLKAFGLKEHGLAGETEGSIKAKLSRGTFPATFMLAVVAAIGLAEIALEDL